MNRETFREDAERALTAAGPIIAALPSVKDVAREAEARFPEPLVFAAEYRQEAFIEGARWAASRAVPAPLPTVEDVARVLAARWWTTQTGETEPWESLTPKEQAAVIENNALDQIAPAVLALLPGRTEAEVKVEALRKGWDEGFADGYRQHAEGEDGPRFTNPYRAVVGAGEQGGDVADETADPLDLEAIRALAARECDLADRDLRKWVRYPVKHLRSLLGFVADLRAGIERIAADWERDAPDRIVGQAVAAELRAVLALFEGGGDRG